MHVGSRDGTKNTILYIICSGMPNQNSFTLHNCRGVHTKGTRVCIYLAELFQSS